MTLADWKRQFRVGQHLLCTYRWYWANGSKPAPPNGREIVRVQIVKATYLIYSSPEKPRVYMDIPRASELKADDKGFELYFPQDSKFGDRAGILMSRYEWVAD